MMKKFAIFILVLCSITNFVIADEDPEDKDALKCIVKYLKEKGVDESFFSSVDTQVNGLDCERLKKKKIDKGFGKIEKKLKDDKDFAKYADCVMRGINTEQNQKIILQREAIKIHGLGVKLWNYFDQKKHLDELKKNLENSINKVAQEKCITVL